MTTTTNIAATILQQLGGSRFVAMTGAAHLCNLGNGLQFRFKGSKRANSARITLDASDTYTVEFFKVKGLNVTPAESYNMVHAESLQTIFTRATGLYTSL